MESGGKEETDADEIEGGEETPFFLLLLIQDDANGGGEGGMPLPHGPVGCLGALPT